MMPTSTATTYLRLATPEDIPSLESLISTSVRALGADIYAPAQVESSLRYVFCVEPKLIADCSYYVIEGASGLIACGGWSRRAALHDGGRWSCGGDLLLDPTSSAARVHALFVHPAWVRRGLETRLLETCATAARDAGFRALDLAATPASVPLYTAMGFSVQESTRVRLPDGVTLPVIRMTRSIVPALRRTIQSRAFQGL